MGKKKLTFRRVWKFIWEDDSIWSWLVNILLAFILIKYMVYPALGFVLSTSHPVVAVVSESMEHDSNFDDWWQNSNKLYNDNGISREAFAEFPLKNGFNKGDIMILKGKNPEDIQIGDIVVFWSQNGNPIIHRIVKKWQEGSIYYFQTKGDNYKTNPASIRNSFLDETKISQDKIIGNAVARIPLLGYIKIWFVELFISPFMQKG